MVSCPECGEPPRGTVQVLLGSQQLVCWSFDMHRFKVTFSQDLSGAIRKSSDLLG